MKKVFLILLLAAAFTGLSMPHVAFAGEAGESGAAGGLATVAPEAAAAQQAAETTYSANQAALGNAVVDGIGAGINWVANKLANLVLNVAGYIVELLIMLVTFFLVIIGSFLNFVISEMVIEMGKYVTSSSAEGVRVAWGIMRDLANIAIIGSLVAIAIGTILHLQNVNAKNVLAKLLIAALLVNFSYFFAGAVIDSSNFLATKIYESAITTDECKGQEIFKCNLASTFMDLVQIQALKGNPDTLKEGIAAGLDPISLGFKAATTKNVTVDILMFNILLLVFELVSIFIFLSAVTLLIGRFVALILVLITSPIGIVAFMLPATTKYAKEWWEALFTQAFFAPIYFLLVGFSFTIIRSSKDAIFSATGSGGNIIALMLTFIVAAVFMLQSLKIAKQMSEKASQFADVYKASGAIAGWMPKAYTTGLKFTGALAARESAGRLADFVLPRYREFAARYRLDQNKNPFVRAGDRFFQESLGKVKAKKFFGFDDFGSVKEKRKAREIELGDVEKDEKQKAELEGRLTPKEQKLYKNLKKKAAAGMLTDDEQAELDRLRKKDPKSLTPTERARLAALDKKMSKGEKEQLEEFDRRKREGGALGKMNQMEEMFQAEYLAGTERLQVSQNRLEELRNKAKGGTLMNHERAELQNLEKISKTKEGLTKEGRLETWGEFWNRQELRDPKLARTHKFKKELADLEAKNAAGTLTASEKVRLEELAGAHADGSMGEYKWGYHERVDAAKIDGKTSFRDSRSDAEAIYASISDGFWEREYDKNPTSIIKLAKILPNHQWSEVRKNPKIRRDIKNAMIRARRGTWAKGISDLQKKIDNGEMLEGGEVYAENTLALFMDQRKNIPDSDEIQDLILSDAAFDESTGERFQDLRKKSVFANVFSSSMFADIKDKRLLSTTEQRDFGKVKRAGFDKVRDQQAGVYVLFGLQSSDHLPHEGGTADYFAAKRAVNWARATLNDDGPTKRLIARAKLDPNSVTKSDLKLAQENLKYAQMVVDAEEKGYNPLESEIKKKIDSITPAEYAAYKARGIQEEELRDAKRLEVMTAAKNKYLAAQRDGVLDNPADRERFLQDPAMFVMDKLVQTENATTKYYEGKNPREVKSIFNNRNWWSTNTPIGIGAEQMKALEGQDSAEVREFFAQFLTRGSDSMIANYATNEHLKSIFEWPEPERMRRINLWRKSMGKAELPETFSEEAIARNFSDEGFDEPPPTGSGPGGGTPFTPSGGAPRGPAPSAPEPVDIPDFTPPSNFSTSEPLEDSGGDADTTFTERQSANIAAAEQSGGGTRIDPGGSSNDYSVAPTDEAPVAAPTTPTPQAAPTQAAPEPTLSPEEYFDRFDRSVPYSEEQIQKAESYMSDWTDEQIVTLPPRVITLALPGIKRPSTVLKILERYSGNADMQRNIVAGFKELDRRGKLTGDIARMVKSWGN